MTIDRHFPAVYAPVYRQIEDRHPRWILRVSIPMFAAFFIWAAWARIDQVAHTRGQIIAASRTQVIQSPDGAVLKELLVREGEAVKQGQVLAVMEKDRVQAAYGDAQAKVAALRITLTRLKAEVYGRPLVFDKELLVYGEFISAQTDLYRKRQRAIQNDVAALEASLRLAKEELEMNEQLLKSGDVGIAEILRLRRQVVEISGQIENRRNKYFQDAQAEMSKAEEDLSTQEQTLSDRGALLEHTELRAPTDGVVRNINITTLGGVLHAGDSVMELLPTDTELIVEVKLQPSDLSFVHVGQPATVKLDAYDYSIFGTMRGEVSYLSPDALSEKTPQGETPYYRVRVRIGEREFIGAQANQIVVSPGMPVSVDIRTGKRTVLSYLSKPVTKTLANAFSER